MDIIVNEGRENELTNIANAVNDDVSAFINSQGLGATVDASDLIVRVGQLDGVDSVTVTKFANEGDVGVNSSISLNANEFMSANTIIITPSTR
jgi:hypothetical protein